MRSEKFFYDYDDYESGEKDALTLAQEVLADSDLPDLDELVIGCWGESYDNSVQSLLDEFTANADKLRHLKSLFIGDMDYEECEVSWIEQGNYETLLAALPGLEKLTIKGSVGLSLGKVRHAALQEIEIICGGLPKNVLHELAAAELPALTKLNLYLGVEEYGFDGGIEDVKALLRSPLMRQLTYLGLGDSEWQDEVVEAVLEVLPLLRLEVLDFSNGTLTDQGGQLLLDAKDKLKNLKKIDLTYHFLSDEMMERLKATGLPFVLDDPQETDIDEDDGYIYRFPMLTE